MLSETASGGLLPIDKVASESRGLLLKGHRGLIISSLVGAVIIYGDLSTQATQCIYE